MTDVILICAAVLLIPLGGLFAAMDTALLTVSVARVDDLIKDERAGALRLRQVLAQRSKYVSIAVLLRILCETAATVVVAVLALGWWDSAWALVLTITLMAVISYVAIGVGPRTLGRQHAYSIALNSAVVVQALGILLSPITRLLIILGNALTPGKGYRNGPFASEIELREVVDMAQERGVVAADERRMIQSVFDLGDTVAREVMVPRPEMIWIEATKTAAQATSLAVRSGHSRIPVIGENSDDIVGVVYLKDLVQQTLPPRRPGAVVVSELMRPAEFIPDSKALDKVLHDMQLSRNHMAMLVDEYGGIAGLVTIEDVLEEIVGEINDEYDTGEVPPMVALDAENPEAGYRVSSRLPLEDLAALFNVTIEEDDVDTVGGLMALAIGRVPLPGSEVSSHGLRLLAEGAADRRGRLRITSVVVTKEEEPPLPHEDSESAATSEDSSTTENASDNGRTQERTP